MTPVMRKRYYGFLLFFTVAVMVISWLAPDSVRGAAAAIVGMMT
jgi:hypothetical protein